MKKYLILFFAFQSITLICQSDYKLNGFGINLVKFGYQYIGLDYIRKSISDKNQILIGVGLLNGVHNSNHQRNINEFDNRFMKTNEEISKGFGFDLQWRAKLFELNENFKFWGALQYNQLNSNIQFYENLYTYQSPFYYFNEVGFKEKLNRKTIGVNANLQFNPNVFFIEFELGLGYNHIKMGENLAKYRNYQMNKFDYAHKGLVPLLGFRLGAFLF